MWLRIDVAMWSHEKILALPNDKARWSWLVLLSRAKERDGCFSSETQLRVDLGSRYRYRWVKVFRELGLLDGLQVHDWDTYQLNRDNSAQRTRRWRARRAGDGDGDASRDGPTGTVHGQRHLESQQSAPKIASRRDESRTIAKDPAEAAIRARLGNLGVPVADHDQLVVRLEDLAAQKGARSLRYVLGRPNAETVSLIEEAVCLWNEQRYAARKADQLADRAPLETLERVAPSADVKAQVSRIIGRISEEEAQPA